MSRQKGKKKFLNLETKKKAKITWRHKNKLYKDRHEAN